MNPNAFVSTEPTSTQSDATEREVPSGSAQEPSDMDQSEQTAPASSPERQEVEEECSEPDSSSSSSSSSTNELATGPAAPSDSTQGGADSPTEGSVELGDLDLENTEEPMEQD